MTLHNKGFKGERDRAVLLTSYKAMCKEFRVPKAKQLTPFELTCMTNAQLYTAAKDLYNNTTVKNAKKLAVKMGLADKPITWLDILVEWLKHQVFDPNPTRRGVIHG